ncbi:MAG: hypothetical protein GY769_18530 [bacterium]|nr:hypothetical protein [bacterium]
MAEKSVLPAAQFDIDLRQVGTQKGDRVLEVVADVENLGSSPLVVENLWIDLLYIEKGEPLSVYQNLEHGAVCGRLSFPEKLENLMDPAAWDANRKKPRAEEKERLKRLGIRLEKPKLETAERKAADKEKSKGRGAKSDNKPRGLAVAPGRTFVMPKVRQRYSLVATLPGKATFALVHAAFYYAPGGSILQRTVVWVLQCLGLTRHSLRDLREPHTCERAFRLDPLPPWVARHKRKRLPRPARG